MASNLPPTLIQHVPHPVPPTHPKGRLPNRELSRLFENQTVTERFLSFGRARGLGAGLQELMMRAARGSLAGSVSAMAIPADGPYLGKTGYKTGL